MSYLPYGMYGNGGFHLPIIDIVQTVNSSSSVGGKNKYDKVKRSVHSIKSAHAKGKITQHNYYNWYNSTTERNSSSGDRKSLTRGCFTKENLLRGISNNNNNTNTNKNYKRAVASRSKLLKYHRRISNRERSSEKKFSGFVGRKKNLRILFKAGKNKNSYQGEHFNETNNEMNFTCDFESENELNKGFANSTLEFKRKESFADLIKKKKKKERNIQSEGHWSRKGSKALRKKVECKLVRVKADVTPCQPDSLISFSTPLSFLCE